MQQTNPKWLLQKYPGDLKAQVRYLISTGYLVINQTSTTAQLNRQKSFSCLFATLSFFFFGIGFFIYLFYYLSKRDDSIYLDTETQPTKKEIETESKALEERPWYKKHPVLTFFGGLIALSLTISSFTSAFGGETPQSTTTQATSTKQAFDVPSLFGKNIDELKIALGTPQYDTEPTSLQLKSGTTEWEKSWEKNGVKLMVTYNIKTKVAVDYFVSGVDPSGATRDKGLLLSVGNLKEGDPRYSLKFVEVINPPTPGLYTGVTVTPR